VDAVRARCGAGRVGRAEVARVARQTKNAARESGVAEFALVGASGLEPLTPTV
jgi:hypothetical protein